MKTKPSDIAPLPNPRPVRLSHRAESQIERVRERTGLKEQEIIRLAAEIGFVAMGFVDDDMPAILARAGIDKARDLFRAKKFGELTPTDETRPAVGDGDRKGKRAG